MDPKMYPIGNELVHSNDARTAPTSTDIIELLTSDKRTNKYITVSDLFGMAAADVITTHQPATDTVQVWRSGVPKQMQIEDLLGLESGDVVNSLNPATDTVAIWRSGSPKQITIEDFVGNNATNQVSTTTPATDYVKLIRSGVPKTATLLNLFGNMANMDFIAYEYTAAGTIDANANYVEINNATPATAINLNLAAPEAGRLLIISQTDAGTAGNTVTLGSGNLATNKHNKLTFNAQEETIVLFGVSSSRFIVVANPDSVAIATAS